MIKDTMSFNLVILAILVSIPLLKAAKYSELNGFYPNIAPCFENVPRDSASWEDAKHYYNRFNSICLAVEKKTDALLYRGCMMLILRVIELTPTWSPKSNRREPDKTVARTSYFHESQGMESRMLGIDMRVIEGHEKEKALAKSQTKGILACSSKNFEIGSYKDHISKLSEAEMKKLGELVDCVEKALQC